MIFNPPLLFNPQIESRIRTQPQKQLVIILLVSNCMIFSICSNFVYYEGSFFVCNTQIYSTVFIQFIISPSQKKTNRLQAILFICGLCNCLCKRCMTLQNLDDIGGLVSSAPGQQKLNRRQSFFFCE